MFLINYYCRLLLDLKVLHCKLVLKNPPGNTIKVCIVLYCITQMCRQM